MQAYSLPAYEDGWPEHIAVDWSCKPSFIACAAADHYELMDKGFPDKAIINLSDQLRWLFNSDKVMATYVSGSMIKAAIDSCLWAITDGLDMVDAIHSVLELTVDECLKDAAENGNLPCCELEDYELANRIVSHLFSFCSRCFAVFKDSGIPIVQTVGAPYEYIGHNVRGLVLLHKKDVVCTAAMLDI